MARQGSGVAWRVALIYLILGLAWIFGSDLYLYYTGGENATAPTAQLIKGSAFVLASAFLVHGLVLWLGASSDRERRRREEVERGYRALVRSMPDAVFTIEPNSGRILDVNPAAEELFRLRRRDLLGLERSFHTDSNDPAFLEYQTQRRDAGQSRAILTMIRGDGRRFPAEVSSAVFRDQSGRLRASCVIRDISDQIERENELEASEARLSELTNLQQAVLNSVFAHIAMVRGDGVVQFANERWLSGAAAILPPLGAALGSDFLALCDELQGPDSRTAQRIATSLRDVCAGKLERADFEFSYLHDHKRCWRRIAITPFAAEGQKGAVVAHMDVTERRAAEARRRLVDAAFRSTGDAILICDENFLILDTNEAYLRITGFDRTEALESKPPFLQIGDQARSVGKALESDGHWRGDLIQQRVDGEVFVSNAIINVVRQEDGEPRRLVVTFSDTSALKEAERQISHLSYHDPITNLPNRAALDQWFSETVHRESRSRPMALIYIDLDRFKAVNEAFGHSVGDGLLKEVARRLERNTGPRDALGRMGGDEFLVIADSVDNDRDALDRARTLLDIVARPLSVESRQFFATASAGVSLHPRDGLSLEELLRAADAALNNAKTLAAKGDASSFRPEMRETVDRQMRIEHGLRFALRRGELELEFQPVARLSDGVLSGAEALLRWNSPQLGRVAPDEFIPVAEATGLIGDIGAWVFEEAARRAARWRNMTTRFDHVAVNVSVVQFHQPGLAEQLAGTLEHFNLPAELFRLEITESVMMLDMEWTIALLARLRGLGFRIAIDDFGTGHSSMTYLRELPVHYLKLDKSFIQRLPDSDTDAHIMESVITLAHRLGIQVVAEGIETDDQYRLLNGWGCDEGQGYLIARPMAAEDLERRLGEGDIRFAAAGRGQGNKAR